MVIYCNFIGGSLDGTSARNFRRIFPACGRRISEEIRERSRGNPPLKKLMEMNSVCGGNAGIYEFRFE